MLSVVVAVCLFGAAIYRLACSLQTPTAINHAVTVGLAAVASALCARFVLRSDLTDGQALAFHCAAVVAEGAFTIAALGVRSRWIKRKHVVSRAIVCVTVLVVVMAIFSIVRLEADLMWLGVPMLVSILGAYSSYCAMATTRMCVRDLLPGQKTDRRLISTFAVLVGAAVAAVHGVIAIADDANRLLDPHDVRPTHDMAQSVYDLTTVTASAFVILAALASCASVEEDRNIRRLWRSLIRRETVFRLPFRWSGLPLSSAELTSTRRLIEIEDALASVEITDDAARHVQTHSDPWWALGAALRDDHNYANPGSGVPAADVLPVDEADQLSGRVVERIAEGFASAPSR